MLDILLWVFLGAFIGWNLPQPDFAKKLQGKVISLFKNNTMF
jgi:hypothetical protein